MKLWLLALSLFLASCSTPPAEKLSSNPSDTSIARTVTAFEVPSNFDWQGHRGCRGLMPENTIPALLHALELGVTTLELDVVITADSLVLLSHEPFFSHELATDPNDDLIEAANEKTHNIYTMTAAVAQTYDVGLRPHPRFPDQQKMAVSKPLLSEVFAAVQHYCDSLNRPLPYFNIETKCNPETDGSYHPEPETFAQLVWDQIALVGLEAQCTIQSFDVRTLQYLHQQAYSGTLALLIENLQSPERNLELLSFTPSIYSCDFHLVSEDLITYAETQNMKVIPWTVNDTSDMKKLIQLGVDGIITDYPDRIQWLLTQE